MAEHCIGSVKLGTPRPGHWHCTGKGNGKHATAEDIRAVKAENRWQAYGAKADTLSGCRPRARSELLLGLQLPDDTFAIAPAVGGRAV
jgi:hypothetical protein